VRQTNSSSTSKIRLISYWATGGTDIGSVEASDWADKGPDQEKPGPYHALGLWLEERRGTLPLKTTYSGARERMPNPIAAGDKPKGYHNEPWHLTMGALGQALHRRHQDLMAQEGAKKARNDSILAAFDQWTATYGHTVKGLPEKYAPKNAGKAKKKAAREKFFKDTKAALEDALINDLTIEDYVNSVHPDVKPQ